MDRLRILVLLCLAFCSVSAEIIQCFGKTCSKHARCDLSNRFLARCKCKPGFTGDGENCTDIDECSTSKLHGCHFNADCINTEGSYICECKNGYIGDGVKVCEDIKECYSASCKGYNATCTDLEGGFICSCPAGYTGDGISSCNDGVVCPDSSHVCSKEATCQYSPTKGVHCVCLPGFTGDGITCLDIDECALNDDNCHEDALCINTPGSFTCECKHGYLGNGKTQCQDIDQCASSPCKGDNSICSDLVGGFRCDCPAGFNGDGLNFCYDGYPCPDEQNVCSKNAICGYNFLQRRLECQCNNGYVGDGVTCTDINECSVHEDHGCHPDADCVNIDGSYRCECKPGFSGDGEYRCTEIKACLSAPCKGYNSVCVEQEGPGYSCLCPDGFNGDGINSCNDGVACPNGTNVCSRNAICQYDLDLGPHCVCKPGYSGNGITCQDNHSKCDAAADLCDKNAVCMDTVESFKCICMAGYAGDGKTCTNINECTEGTDTCHKDAFCTDTVGSYKCTCNSGYRGDGETCTNIDECDEGTDTCHEDAICTDTDGSYKCTCNSGYAGDGRACTNINECFGGSYPCHESAKCMDTSGSYICKCNPGHHGNGFNCSNIDECTEGTHTCHKDATCTDTDGSYNCTCTSGYTGDGRTCTITFLLKDVTSLSCPFDSDLCGWSTTSLAGSPTFTLNRNNTLGPALDFNSRSEKGGYLGLPFHTGNNYKALLVSPPVAKMSTPLCLTFAYTTTGDDVDPNGFIGVYLRKPGVDVLPTSSLSLTNNMPHQWNLEQITLRPTDVFEIVIEGRRNAGKGEVAIDDVRVRQGACQQRGSNDFENSFDTYQNVWNKNYDVFDWTIRTRSTSTRNTGPTGDHTTGTGHYAYIEASSPQEKGEKAVLVTPVMNERSGPQCLQFWYHMYGSHIGTLQVRLGVLTPTAGRLSLQESLVWSLSGEQGNTWMKASVPFNANGLQYQFMFEGIVDTSLLGDIAIDDITINQGSCNLLPAKANGFSIDECKTGTHNCHKNANCTNNGGGSHSCFCKSGYTENGQSCKNIDECTTGSNPCHKDAKCTDTDGSYKCDCNSGYAGDGKTCTIITTTTPKPTVPTTTFQTTWLCKEFFNLNTHPLFKSIPESEKTRVGKPAMERYLSLVKYKDYGVKSVDCVGSGGKHVYLCTIILTKDYKSGESKTKQTRRPGVNLFSSQPKDLYDILKSLVRTDVSLDENLRKEPIKSYNTELLAEAAASKSS